MKFNHVTIHVPEGTLYRPSLSAFLGLIGFEEIPANDKYEHGWNVRWFCPRGAPGIAPNLHLIETDDGEQDSYALGHICVAVSQEQLDNLVRPAAEVGGWLDRDSGSGRIWLRFDNIRVEVRPS